MSRGNGSRKAALLWLLSVAFAVASLVLYFQNWSTAIPERWGDSYSRGIGVFFFVLAFSSVGILIALRRSENPIGWIFLGVGLGFGVQQFCEEYAIYALLTQPGVLPGGVLFTWLASWCWPLVVGPLATYFFLFFPDGRLQSSRWRPVAWLGALSIVATAFAEATRPGPLNVPYASNPFGLENAKAALDYLRYGGILLLAFSGATAAVSMIIRYFRSHGTERQQLKWIASSSAMMAISMVLNAFGLKWAELLLIFAMLSIPITAGIAILRHRLYDIDILINRTLVYGALTATLALLYWGCVVLLQQVFRALAGPSSDVAIILSTLATVVLFQPVRLRIQSLIDQRFYRKKYDATKVLASFAATARDEVELDQLTGRLVEVVEETVQPAHISLWLRKDAASRSSTAAN